MLLPQHYLIQRGPFLRSGWLLTASYLLFTRTTICLLLPSSAGAAAGKSFMTKTLPFPKDFVWGTSTASYQIEGGWDVGGKGWSIWDAFSHTQDGVKNNDNGDIACDHYHKMEQDVQLMKDMGVKHYRFSVSWPRIQRTGRGPPNAEGLAFYNKLVDTLLAAGITPLISLYHWDLPLALQIEFGGWQGRELVNHFEAYAKICFENFGDRVKTWLTFNEPWCVCVLGYGTGEHAPGIKSPDASKVYDAGHTVLLAHAKAVHCYRTLFQQSQKGKIGITLNANYSYPKPAADPQAARRNKAAAERAMLFNLGWFAEPIWGGKGNYPQVMIDRCGDRLPQFTAEERSLLNGSSDFFGINHYMSDLAEDASVASTSVSSSPPQEKAREKEKEEEGTKHNMLKDVNESSKPRIDMMAGMFNKKAESNSNGIWGDMDANFSFDPAWPLTDMSWAVVPEGFGCLLTWIHNRYKPPGGIIVTENGCAVAEPTKEAGKADYFRVNYYNSYCAAMHEVMQKGVDVRGYYTWTLMDNFEWALGYSRRFGLHWVDYDSPKLERYPKASALWFAKVIKDNALVVKTAAGSDVTLSNTPAPST